MTSGNLQIPSLDGVRAVSFGVVFLAHAGLDRVIPGPFGVTVFFFLSGYLITTLMRVEFQKTGGISLSRFYTRRALRIWPPFYIVLVLSLMASWLSLYTRPVDPGAIRALLLHFANYYIVVHDHHGFPAGTGVYWSLAVEEHFYLLFPILFLLMQKSGWSVQRQLAVLMSICAAVLVWRCVLVIGFDSSYLRTGIASDARFDSLLAGCALAVYGNPALDDSRFSERTWKQVLFPLGVAGLLLCFVIRADTFRETIRYSIQGLSLVPLFVCAVRYPMWMPMRFLNWRPVAFVGVLSYSLYLTHLLTIEIARENFQTGPVLQGAAALIGALVLSWALWQVVEKPCARIRRRLHS